MPVLNDWNEYDRHFGFKNLIINGEFPNNIGNWRLSAGEGEIYWENGRLVFESDGSAIAYQSVDLEEGKRYSFSAETFSEGVTGYVQLRIGNTYKSLGSGTISNYEFDASTLFQVRLRSYGGAGRCSFDNISLVEV